jgi:hypothetical protein
MNVIAMLFLRAKHWQLFIVSVILFLVEVFVVRPHLSVAGSPALISGAETAIDVVFLLAWVWSAGLFLNSIVQPSLRLNLPLFYFSLILPVLLFAWLAPSLVPNDHSPLPLVKTGLRVLAFVCTIYDIGFVADLLIRAETGKPAPFIEVAGQFLLIWFFVIGVWFIQPRINRLYAERMRASTAPSL